MRNKRKIFNDPIYGLISFPFEILYDLIEHPFFQRLRRISQMGLSHYVYPGACHSRFHHALGALHLVTRCIYALRDKGIKISHDEFEGVCIAILLHDIGHGPFSHTLENKIISKHHEEISLMFMQALNKEFDGRLALGIEIFQNNYPKHFLHQLVSSQLDMDRMDYLTRDSFYTGVIEGKVGYDRIISMLNVVEDNLVIEEKAIYSVEKFLSARRIMYWQVYLHKTALAAEQMLKKTIELSIQSIEDDFLPKNLSFFVSNKEHKFESTEDLEVFSKLDDHDIWYTLKNLVYSRDRIIRFYADSILQRKLFKIEFSSKAFTSDYKEDIRHKICSHFKVREGEAAKLILNDNESNQAYTTATNEILILRKTGKIIPFSELSENLINTQVMVKYFLCYPRI